MADFGQTDFGQNRLWPNYGACVCGWFLCVCVCACVCVLGVLGVVQIFVGVIQMSMDFRGCHPDFFIVCVIQSVIQIFVGVIQIFVGVIQIFLGVGVVLCVGCVLCCVLPGVLLSFAEFCCVFCFALVDVSPCRVGRLQKLIFHNKKTPKMKQSWAPSFSVFGIPGRTAPLPDRPSPRQPLPRTAPLPDSPSPGPALPGPPLPLTAPPQDNPPPDRPKFRSFFFPLPPPFSLFLCLSGGLLVEFWWCF